MPDRARNLANQHRRRRELRAAGLCTGCRRVPARPRRRMCAACAREDSARVSERYRWLLAQGLCVACHCAPRRENRTRCVRCWQQETATRKGEQAERKGEPRCPD